ncbi:hypothetical protein ACR6C2_01915 [Streptomyces sp. INA 01156]
MSSRDVLALTTVPAAAVVVDEIGEYEALGVAELLVEAGAHVTFVTPFAAVGLPAEATGRPSTALGRLRAHGRFTALPLSMAVAVTRPPSTSRTSSGTRCPRTRRAWW